MERISLQHDRKAIIAEHVHRYKICSILASGSVLDISCGIGYGSDIICENPTVSGYLGIDISATEIEYATKQFANDKKSFALGNICSLTAEANTFDTIVSLETLEHIEDPNLAIQELARVLKQDGILCGSVPEKDYDDECERVYGPNPFHLHKFSKQDLKSSLEKHFASVEIISIGVVFGTNVEGHSNSCQIMDYQKPKGSYFFLATHSNRDLKIDLSKISGLFIPALSMPEYDEENSNPLRTTIYDLEERIRERDTAIQAIENLVKEKDIAIQATEKRIHEKDEVIKILTKTIDDKDEAIKAMEEVIETRWKIIQEYDAKVKALEGVE